MQLLQKNNGERTKACECKTREKYGGGVGMEQKSS